ncbi:MAG TPA: ASCH domain-containing protein [Tepidisphaeraceae bacterium]|jgi:hypothetical protein
MLALSIRQPFAELILRGIKTVEYRSRPTRVIGRRFYIYATKGNRGQRSEVKDQPDRWPLTSAALLWSRDLAVPAGEAPPPPAWMIELAEQVGMIEPGALALLPRGVIVGSAVVERVEEIRGQRSEGSKGGGLTSDLRPLTSIFAWHLADVERARALRKPAGRPQPVWFNPF